MAMAMAANLLLGEEEEKRRQDTSHLLTSQTAELSSSHLAGEHQNEDVVPIQRGYCRDLLFNDGAELCFEEVRAQVLRARRQKQLDEKRQSLREERKQLELQVARMSSLLNWPARHSASRHVLEDPALPPRPSCGTSEELRANDAAHPEGAAASQLCNRSHDPIQDHQVLSPAQEVSRSSTGGGAVRPCEADLRRQLLERCDITSCANFHLEARPLPDIREHASVWLGSKCYQTQLRLLEESDVLAYKGFQEDDAVIIKVDRCPLPWDFYMYSRLARKSGSAAAEPPPVRCYQFRDGCVTVYVAPPSHVFSELSERVQSEDLAAVAAAHSLLNLTSAMHACGVAHTALRPDVLVSCHTAEVSAHSGWLFPLDWRAAVEVQENMVSLKRRPAASELVRVGLLDAAAPPQLVDLMGVAQILHLLLTKRKLVPVRDAAGWAAEGFQQGTPRAWTDNLWCDVFRSLLNADAGSWAAVTSELLEILATYRR